MRGGAEAPPAAAVYEGSSVRSWSRIAAWSAVMLLPVWAHGWWGKALRMLLRVFPLAAPALVSLSQSPSADRRVGRRIETGQLVDTYARSEDTRRKALKYGPRGTTLKAYKPRA